MVRNRDVLSLVLLLGVSFVTATAARATEFFPTQDTYVSERDGGGPNGSLAYLRAKNEDGDDERLSYIEFDTSAASAFDTATLYLTPTDSTLGDDPNGTATFEVFGQTGVSWDESTLTYQNDGVLLNGAQSLGTFGLTDKGLGSTVAFSGGDLATFLGDNPGVVTLIVRRTAWDGGTYVHQFASSNSTAGNGPKLDIVPEPTTLVMLSLGASAALRRRRTT